MQSEREPRKHSTLEISNARSGEGPRQTRCLSYLLRNAHAWSGRSRRKPSISPDLADWASRATVQA
jgi:hypothetical protein